MGKFTVDEMVAKWLVKRGFNILMDIEENVARFFRPGIGIVVTESENQVIQDTFTDFEDLEEKTKKVLAEHFYLDKYEDANLKLEAAWKEAFEGMKKHHRKMNAFEEKAIKGWQEEVYKYRAMADTYDPELKEARQEWMQMHPLSEKKFAKYAQMLNVMDGTPEYEHARLLAPTKLFSRIMKQNRDEYRQALLDELNDPFEKNRDSWFQTDARGRDSKAREDQKRNEKSAHEEITDKLCRAFAWVGGEVNTIQDIGTELYLRFSREDQLLFVGDMISQRLEYLEIPESQHDWITEQLFCSGERYNKYLEESKKREDWRAKVRAGEAPSFEYDLYKLGFFRGGAVQWKELGGYFKSIWGAKLRFEGIKDMDPVCLEICRSIDTYQDDEDKEVKSHGKKYESMTPESIHTYVKARNYLYSKFQLRKKGTDDELGNFLKKYVKLRTTQDKGFCAQLSTIEGIKLPKDDMNPKWNDALYSGVEYAKETMAAYAREMVIFKDYSSFDDLYGEEAETMAMACLLEIGKLAKEAAAEQAKMLEGIQIADFVESECPEF